MEPGERSLHLDSGSGGVLCTAARQTLLWALWRLGVFSLCMYVREQESQRKIEIQRVRQVSDCLTLAYLEHMSSLADTSERKEVVELNTNQLLIPDVFELAS